MAAYTIEDIELIRRKSGISYQEAVALLDYHNGSVTRALIDLERSGRILPEGAQTKAMPEKKGGFFQKLFRTRFKVSKGSVAILNVSAITAAVALIFSPHLAIAGLIAALVLGYRMNVQTNDPDFAGDNLERMVKNAAENVRSSVSDMARGFADGLNHSTASAAKEPVQETSEEETSFYEAAASVRTAAMSQDIPTIQVPVKVESSDGDISIEQDHDGYGSATIG